MINVAVTIDAEMIVKAIEVLAEEMPGYGYSTDLLTETFEDWIDYGSSVDLFADDFESWVGFLLEIIINPVAGGSVTKTPSWSSYPWNKKVVLQAFPNMGWIFLKWTGDLSGSANPTNIYMNANKSVTANFSSPD